MVAQVARDIKTGWQGLSPSAKKVAVRTTAAVVIFAVLFFSCIAFTFLISKLMLIGVGAVVGGSVVGGVLLYVYFLKIKGASKKMKADQDSKKASSDTSEPEETVRKSKKEPGITISASTLKKGAKLLSGFIPKGGDESESEG